MCSFILSSLIKACLLPACFAVALLQPQNTITSQSSPKAFRGISENWCHSGHSNLSTISRPLPPIHHLSLILITFIQVVHLIFGIQLRHLKEVPLEDLVNILYGAQCYIDVFFFFGLFESNQICRFSVHHNVQSCFNIIFFQAVILCRSSFFGLTLNFHSSGITFCNRWNLTFSRWLRGLDIGILDREKP